MPRHAAAAALWTALTTLALACGSEDPCREGESACAGERGTFWYCFSRGPSHGAVLVGGAENVLEHHQCEGIDPVCRPLGEDGVECVDEGELLTCSASQVVFEHMLPTTSHSVEWTDVDRDGRFDLLYECRAKDQTSCGLWLARGREDGGFDAAAEVGQFVGLTELVPQLGDVDGDGNGDLVVLWKPIVRDDAPDDTPPPPSTLEVLLGEGAGFAPARRRKLDDSTVLRVVGDLDADGADDIVLATERSVVILTVDNGELLQRAELEVEPDMFFEPGPAAAGIVDLDGSGRPYLVVGAGATAPVYQWSDGKFARQDGLFVTTSEIMGDLDGDGATDNVSLGTGTRPRLYLRISNRDGTFATHYSEPLPYMNPPFMAAADFDGDGHLDVAAVHQRQRVSVLVGTGGGLFAAPKTFEHDHEPQGVWLAADADGDGSTDLVDFAFDSSTGMVKATMLARACL